MSRDPLYIFAVLCLLIVVSEWLARRPRVRIRAAGRLRPSGMEKIERASCTSPGRPLEPTF